MQVSSRHQYLAALAAGLGISLPAANAVEPYDILVHSLGPVLIRPKLDLMEVYESNVFYRDRDEQDNFATYFQPGFNLFLGEVERNYISFDYQLIGIYYAQDKTDPRTGISSRDLDRFDHSLSLQNHWEFGRFELTGQDNLDLRSGLLGGASNFEPRPTERLEQNHHYRLRAEVSPKTHGTFALNVNQRDYESSSFLLDRLDWRTTAGANYAAFSKTSLLAEAYFGQAIAEKNSGNVEGADVNAIGGFLGALGEFTPKLSGELRVGYEGRERDDGEDTAEGAIGELSLEYNLSPKTQFELTYSRRHSLSIQPGSAGYAVDEFNLRARQALGTSGKWSAFAAVEFQNRDYVGTSQSQGSAFDFDNRNDKYYSVQGGIVYQIQDWISTGLTYRFAKFETNVNLIEYDAHSVAVNLTIGY